MKKLIIVLTLSLYSYVTYAQGIVGYEYWLDYNMESRVSNTTNGDIDIEINCKDLTYGLHTLTLRAVDSNGLWTPPLTCWFVVLEPTKEPVDYKIKGYRYWFNNDVDNAVGVELEEQRTPLDLSVWIDKPTSTIGWNKGGENLLHLFFYDTNGNNSNLISTTFLDETLYLEPILEETTITAAELAGIDLQNVTVSNIYFNLPGDNGYDATEDCILINDASTSSVSIDENDETKEEFIGLKFMVNGKGTITLDAQSMGNKLLYILIGNASPDICRQEERDNIEIPYDVNDPTLVSVFVGMPTRSQQRASASSNCVKIWSLSVKPTTSGINIAMQSSKMSDCYYTINGSRIQGKSVRKGIYVSNGRKVIAK